MPLLFTPKYKHDRDCCTFIGQGKCYDRDGIWETWDYYYCEQGSNRPTLIMRFSDAPQDNQVTPVSKAMQEPVLEWYKQAYEAYVIYMERIGREKEIII
jgi:hypothetical protein